MDDLYLHVNFDFSSTKNLENKFCSRTTCRYTTDFNINCSEKLKINKTKILDNDGWLQDNKWLALSLRIKTI